MSVSVASSSVSEASECSSGTRLCAEEVAAPEEFLCPISLQLMSAPVKCLQTQMIYDRSSFHAWLAQGGQCDPMTGTKLTAPVILRPQLALQDDIRAWCAANGIEYVAEEFAVRKISHPRTRWSKSFSAIRTASSCLFSRQSHPFDAYDNLK